MIKNFRLTEEDTFLLAKVRLSMRASSDVEVFRRLLRERDDGTTSTISKDPVKTEDVQEEEDTKLVYTYGEHLKDKKATNLESILAQQLWVMVDKAWDMNIGEWTKKLKRTTTPFDMRIITESDPDFDKY